MYEKKDLDFVKNDVKPWMKDDVFDDVKDNTLVLPRFWDVLTTIMTHMNLE